MTLDFSAIDAVLTFDGSDNGLTYPLLIEDDNIGFEFDESFTITLSNPQPDSVALSPDTITITIRDNDGRVYMYAPDLNLGCPI